MRVQTVPLTWSPLDIPNGLLVEARLQGLLQSWERTPYAAGQQVPRAGVDCIRFVTAILDGLNQFQGSPLDVVPSDAAMHSREGAVRTIWSFCRAYGLKSHSGPETQPGDVVLVAFRGGGPGHAMIVGPKPNTLWHVSTRGVCRCGWSLPAGMHYSSVFRQTDRKKWQ